MLLDFQQLVASLARDDSGKITPVDRDSAIALAVDRYSVDRPRTLVEDVTSAAGNMLPLPASWEADFSSLMSLEWPIGEAPPSLIANDAFQLYDSPTGTEIMLSGALNANDVVRATFTIRHVVDSTQDTVKTIHREPVASYAASLLLNMLAAEFSGDSDATIQADNVDHNSKAAEYAARARRLNSVYYDALGIPRKKATPASAVVNLTLQNSRGRDRLTHPGRLR